MPVLYSLVHFGCLSSGLTGTIMVMFSSANEVITLPRTRLVDPGLASLHLLKQTTEVYHLDRVPDAA